jgi:hypothetical protein
MEDMRYMQIFVGIPEGKGSPERHRRRVEDNIRMDVGKTF